VNTVAHTAFLTAAVRALESERPDCLFTDPFARSLAGEEGFRLLGAPADSMPDVGHYIVIRTRFLDDFAIAATHTGIRQAVIIAAGMDTRALRLPWPTGVTVFELDHPQLLAIKNAILAVHPSRATATRIPVAADLNASWIPALLDAGFANAKPSLWVAEGLFYYLPENAVAEIIACISANSAPGSALGTDFINRATLTSPWTKAAVNALAARGTPWLSAVDDPAAFLALFGWSARVASPGEPGAGEGRWPYPVVPRSMQQVPHSFMVTAYKEPTVQRTS
jgi:methyltransferase (TIGR00027 family)